jgi:hypothetical protein
MVDPWCVVTGQRVSIMAASVADVAGLGIEREVIEAAERIVVGAQPLSQNAFKVDLGRHSVVRALSMAQGVT